jgi:hypothetical protein
VAPDAVRGFSFSRPGDSAAGAAAGSAAGGAIGSTDAGAGAGSITTGGGAAGALAGDNDKRGFILSGGVGSSLMGWARRNHFPGLAKPKKDSLAVLAAAGHGLHLMFTSKRVAFSALSLSCLALALSSGCLHGKKNAKPKESTEIASEVEAGFKQRFMEKRVTELTAQGVAAEAARVRANDEFRAKYGATTAAQK